MAWIKTETGEGPYPMHRGEFCGNHLPGSTPSAPLNESAEEALRHQKEWLKGMRFGAPRDCPSGTSAEMEAKGWVGLYMKETQDPFRGFEKEVPTSRELMEPHREAEYNLDGPGIK